MKAVLVIDMPEKCYKCPYFSHGTAVGYNCDISCGRHIEVPQERSDWCPLRPLPEKRNTTSLIETRHEAEENHVTPQHQAGFNLGWNACLEAITGGTYDETEDD